MGNAEWPKQHIRDYRTTNPSILSEIRPLFVNSLIARLTDNKISCWFDWQVKNIPKDFKGRTLAGDQNATLIRSRLDELRMHFGMWDQVYQISPKDENVKEWRYGFLISDKGSDRLSICSLILEGPVRILIGPVPVTVYARDLNSRKEISIQVSDLFSRHDPKNKYPLI